MRELATGERIQRFMRALGRADELWSALRAIEPELYRYPAVSATSFRAALEHILLEAAGPSIRTP